MTPEKIVQNSILAYLKKLKDQGKPIFYERRQAVGFGYAKGLPDIYGSYDGHHFEIEVKKPGGHTSTMQDKYAYVFKKINVKYVCADNVDAVMSFFQKEFKI